MEIKIVPSTMKKIGLNSVVGVMSVIIGGGWLIPALLIPFVRFLQENDKLADSLVRFPITILFALPGIVALYFGIRLIKATTKRNIKGSVGGCSIIFVFLLFGVIFQYIAKFIHIANIIPFLFATLLVLPLYVYLSRFLMIKENLTPVRGEFIGKGIVLIISCQIWLASNQLINYFIPLKHGSEIREDKWMSVSVFGSIFIAILFYKSAMFIINRSKSGANGICAHTDSSCELKMKEEPQA